jgi:benzoate 4-monooxygenase
MIRAARDTAPVAIKQEAAMASYGEVDEKGDACTRVEVIDVPAIKILNERGEFTSALGTFPAWSRLAISHLVPWFSKRNVSASNVAGIAIAAVAKRLANPTDRSDLLSKLQQGKDENGNLMGREELTAEAQTLMIAGSDTTSKYVLPPSLISMVLIRVLFNSTMCALTYHLARNSAIQARLHTELDEVFGSLPSPTDVNEPQIAAHAQIKHFPYLEAVIQETLRIHSTAGLGLPRVVSEAGLTVLGKTFPEGTVLSVPTNSLHRNSHTWGGDADVFRPERWLDAKGEHSEMMKSFNPFSFGPRYGRSSLSLYSC